MIPYCYTVTLLTFLLLSLLLLSSYHPSKLGDMNIRQLTSGWKIDGRDNVCILGECRIQVAQPKYGFTVGFWGMTDISSVYCSTVILYFYFYWLTSDRVCSAPVSGSWSRVCSYPLKTQIMSPPISFNNIRPNWCM